MCGYQKYMIAKWNMGLSPTRGISKECRNSCLLKVLVYKYLHSAKINRDNVKQSPMIDYG
jgi:hypothetical protein